MTITMTAHTPAAAALPESLDSLNSQLTITDAVVPPRVRRAAEQRLAAVKDYYGLPEEVRIEWEDDGAATQSGRHQRAAGWVDDRRPLLIHLDASDACSWSTPGAKHARRVQHLVTHEAVHVMQALRDGPDALLSAVRANHGHVGRYRERPWEREAEAEARAFERNRRNQRARDRRGRHAGRAPQRLTLPWAAPCVLYERWLRAWAAWQETAAPRDEPPDGLLEPWEVEVEGESVPTGGPTGMPTGGEEEALARGEQQQQP